MTSHCSRFHSDRSLNYGDYGQVLPVVQKLERQLGNLGMSISAEEGTEEVITGTTRTFQEQVDALIDRVADESRSY